MEQESFEWVGTLNQWSKMLQIPKRVLGDRLKDVDKKDADGNPIEFTEAFIRDRCGDLLRDSMPKADEHGFFVYKGSKFGSKESWVRICTALGVDEYFIRKGLEKIKGFTARAQSGYVRKEAYYSENLIGDICHNYFHPDEPRIGNSGFIYLGTGDGRKLLGTRNAWARVLGINSSTLRRKLAKQAVAPNVFGTNKLGTKVALYAYAKIMKTKALGEMKAAAPEFIQRVDSQGQLQRYGTTARWAIELNVSRSSLRRKVRKLSPFKEQLYGETVSYYAESDVQRIFGQAPEANESESSQKENELDSANPQDTIS